MIGGLAGRVSCPWTAAGVVALLVVIAMALSACGAQTTPATNVGQRSAELNGTVTWSNGDGPGEFWFEYSGNNGASWASTPHEPFPKLSSAGGPTAVPPHGINGLSPNTHYLYRIAGCLYQYGCSGSAIAYFDSTGSSSGNNWSSFTTPPDQSLDLGVDTTANPALASSPSSQGQGLQITPGAHDQPRVMLSVPVDPPTFNDQRLKIRGEFHVSSCRDVDIQGNSYLGRQTPCVNMNSETEGRANNPYTTHLEWQVIYADSPTATSGGMPITNGWDDAACSLNKHRCPFTVAGEPTFTLPNGTSSGYVNLVAAATSNGVPVQGPDVVQVDGETPTQQNQLSVMRLGANRSRGPDQTTSTSPHADAPPAYVSLDNGDRLYYREQVTSGQGATFPHAVLVDADGTLQAQVACAGANPPPYNPPNQPCSQPSPWPFVQSRILLTQTNQSQLRGFGPDDHFADGVCEDPIQNSNCRADTSGQYDQAVTPNNAANCVWLIGDPNNQCISRQTGIAKIPARAPSPMFLTFIARADKANSGDNNYVRYEGGSLTASCTPVVATESCSVSQAP
jgi:hypothetical protein